MSPEQARGLPVTEASDWFSVGVMLYEALSGRQPFGGGGAGSLPAELPRPSALAPGVPADLQALCLALLRTDPDQRAGGVEVERVLAADSGLPALSAIPAPVPAFVGRGAELAVLAEAYRGVREDGRCAALMVQGPAGIGKSHLLQHFIAGCRARDPELLVLQGRCFQRESVRFKTLDPLVDGLSSHLLELPADEVRRLVPPGTAALVRLFPVLQRIAALGEAPPAPVDAAEARDRALAALRHLLVEVARRRPLILTIEDLHWGDADSAPFLYQLLNQPEPPPLLLLGTCNAEEIGDDPLAQRLLRLRGVRRLDLGPLAPDDARRLAGARADADVDAIVREAGGNPLLLTELAHLAGPGGAGDLVAILTGIIERLPADARALLETLAVAGRPLPVQLAVRAAGLGTAGVAVSRLCAERLVRRRPAPGDELLSLQHDRVQAAALAPLGPAELGRRHLALAGALEAAGEADPDRLVEHWLAAGDRPRAAQLAVAAAEAARAGFAFHRAARCFELAIELQEPGAEALRGLRRALADALALAGRPSDAAEVYRAAAAADPDAAIELLHAAMTQYLQAGRPDEGIAVANEILPAVGLARVPASGRGALVRLLAGRARQRLRGHGFTQREAAAVPARERQRTEILWSLATALGFDDPVIGMVMQNRHLRQALRAGEPIGAARALALETCYVALSGAPARAEALTPRVMALAERSRDPRAIGVATTAIGVAAFVSGRWRRAEVHLARGRAIAVDRGAGLRWESDLANNMRMAALVHLGELAELQRVMPVLIQEAEQRGNHYAAGCLRGWRSNFVWLAMGQPGEALRNADRAHPTGGRRRPSHDYLDLVTRMTIDLYRGDGAAAWARVDAVWRELRQRMLQRFPNPYIEIQFLRARAALACAAAGDRRADMLAAAAEAARALARGRLAWGPPCGALVDACIHVLERRPEPAADALVSATIGFEAVDMMLLAEVCRWLRGALAGGTDGAALIAEARGWMLGQQVAEPERMLGLYAPVPAAPPQGSS
jgi:hypothetical protein